MPSISRCPECQGQIQVPEEFFGRKVKCPTCGAQFTAGAGSGAAPMAPAAPAPRPPYEEDEYDDEYDDSPRPRRRPRRLDYEPHRASTILVLGILSLVLCTPLGVFAWIMGNNDMQRIRGGYMDPEGEGMTQAGRICGIVGTVFMFLQCICGIFYGLALVGAGAAGGFR